MKKQLLFVALLLATTGTMAQTQDMGQPVSWKAKVQLTKKTIEMPAVDNAAETTAEMQRRASSFEKNLRFGKEQTVEINFMDEAQVQILPNGDVLRQLRIHSAGAHSINLIFSHFELATGARLYLFDKEKTEYIGAHTSLNNNANRIMGTELIHSEEMIIELTEPATVAGKSTLVIGTVVHGYLDLESELKDLNESGDCMYDVNCPIGAGWENQRNAVAMMVDGGGFCTGSLVNNTSGNIIPYFLSANHCGTTPSGWVFRFRWESPAAQADCATSANSVDGPTNMNVNGGVLRANYAPSDFALTELNAVPDPSWGVYYNGWNRTNTPATSAVGIHHPSGDIKKISFENQALISTTFGNAPADSHWGVTQWDNGVTEGGSSGSPLFDQNHRTVGQLHGGLSNCGNPSNQLSDEYGKFYMSWTGGGTDATRLSNWLDPNGTNSEFIDGVDPSGPGAAIDASVGSLQGVSGIQCTGTVIPQINITNNGTTPLTSVTVTYGFDGNTNQVYNWTGNLAQYATATVTLPSTTLTSGSHSFEATLSNPNNATDEVTANNSIGSTFTTIIDPETANLSLTLDCYGSETSWQITDNSGSTVYYSGSGYSDSNNGGEVITGSYCLAPGCYKFTIEDSYGDGIQSNGCNNTGSFSLTDGNLGTVLASLSTAQANFGTSNTQSFCIGTNGINENDMLNLWGMYPNPASDKVSVNVAAISGNKVITVLTTTGQEVMHIETSTELAIIPVSDLSEGIYFVQLSSEYGVTTKTLVVK